MKEIAIITGANRGLGEELSNLFLERKEALVISISRKVTPIQETYLKSNKFIFIQQDLSTSLNYNTLNKLFTVINSEAKILFFNNAATILPVKEFKHFTDKEINNSLSINISCPVLLIKFILSNFRDNTIDFVNISSGAANKSISHWSLYSSAKAFFNHLFSILKEEHKDNPKLRFHTLEPGLIDTEMQAQIRSTEFPQQVFFAEAKEKGKLLSSKEVAQRILKSIEIK